MDPNQTFNGGPNMDLPAPLAPIEQLAATESAAATIKNDKNPELLIGTTASAAPSAPASSVPVSTDPIVASTVDPAGNDAAQIAVASPLIADDTDLIEKEWVEKAKAIVNHTKNDPHIQNKQINSMKADYLKKRYNKDIPQA